MERCDWTNQPPLTEFPLITKTQKGNVARGVSEMSVNVLVQSGKHDDDRLCIKEEVDNRNSTSD